MKESVLRSVAELRSHLHQTCPWMTMKVIDIEDELFHLHGKMIELQEENLRLKHLIPRFPQPRIQ